ncbi:MAG: murein biosynthesis integral membrane protein MurJ, partial [Caldiserica bacterium]|nr:murein biosynthesis integral membrane protein MurJ [Caldisericota bacterium]
AAFWKVSGSFLSKVLGFVRDILVAKIFGATYIVDVAQLVESVLLNIVTFVTSPISIPLVPELTHARLQSERDYRGLLSSVFGLFSIAGLILFTVVAAFPGSFVALFSGGFKGAVLGYAEYTYRWMAALSVIIVVSATLKTALAVKKDFILLSFGDVLMNVVVISGLLFGARQMELPILKTGAQLVSVLALWVYFGIREKWFLLPRYGRWDPRVKSLLKQAGPLFIGSATDMLLILIDRTMASFLPEGSIASLGYAQKIYLLPLGVWAVQIAESSYPYIVSAFATGDVGKAYKLARGAIQRILFFIVPAMAGLLLLAPSIVRVIYQRGAFTEANTALVARVLQGYLGVLLFSSVQYIETRLFYARRNTMTPMFISVASLTMNVALNYLLGFVFHLGAYGLAIASSIAAFVSMTLMYLVYRRKYGAVDYVLIFRDVLKMAGGTLIMAAVIVAAQARVHILPLIAVAFVSYLTATVLLREDEATGYLRLGRRLLERIFRRN